MINTMASFLTENSWLMWVIIGVVLVLFMVWSSFSNKKRMKHMNDMHTTIRVGDEIMTIGGIVGTIIEVKEITPVDKEFVIETGVGDKKSTMKFDMRALHENRTRMKEVQAEAAKNAEIARLQKEAKRTGAEITSELTEQTAESSPEEKIEENK